MFRLKTNGNLQYYVIDEFENTGLVKHCFSTRNGGVSENEFKSLNLRMDCGDKRENILQNYKIICDEINVNFEDLVFSKQVHDDKIYIADKSDCGNGITKPQKLESADCLITQEVGVPLAVFGADCVPLYFLDTKNRVIALAHSGWKGTVLRIAEKTIRTMTETFSSKPENILTAIGPSIRSCHYEVGDEVSEVFLKEFGESVLEKHEKYHVNMQKAIMLQFKNMGILEKNIIDSGICTYCNSDLLFSHRKTNGKRGVMAAIMEIKE